MATYFVRPDGNNANAGTADTAAGAWATVKYALANAQNGVLANGDKVFIVADQGNYTENAISNDRTITVQGLRGIAVIDGTGGAAGSDIITYTTGGWTFFRNILLQNAVDKGLAHGATGWAMMVRCGASACGGDGFTPTGGNWRAYYTYARSCGGKGIAGGAGLPDYNIYCETGDNTGTGLELYGALAVGCLSYDNGGDGIAYAAGSASNAASGIVNCTSEGNTSDGFDPGAVYINGGTGGVHFNNVFSNNGAYGAKDHATETTLLTFYADFNNFYGNATAARGNTYPTGTGDTAVNPTYVDAANDDYSLETGSPMIGTGYSPFKSPMKLSQGATIAEVAAASGGGGTGFLGLRSGL